MGTILLPAIAAVVVLAVVIYAVHAQRQREKAADLAFNATMEALKQRALRDKDAEIYSNGDYIVIYSPHTQELESEIGLKKTKLTDTHLTKLGYELIGDL